MSVTRSTMAFAGLLLIAFFAVGKPLTAVAGAEEDLIRERWVIHVNEDTSQAELRIAYPPLIAAPLLQLGAELGPAIEQTLRAQGIDLSGQRVTEDDLSLLLDLTFSLPAGLGQDSRGDVLLVLPTIDLYDSLGLGTPPVVPARSRTIEVHTEHVQVEMPSIVSPAGSDDSWRMSSSHHMVMRELRAPGQPQEPIVLSLRQDSGFHPTTWGWLRIVLLAGSMVVGLGFAIPAVPSPGPPSVRRLHRLLGLFLAIIGIGAAALSLSTTIWPGSVVHLADQVVTPAIRIPDTEGLDGEALAGIFAFVAIGAAIIGIRCMWTAGRLQPWLAALAAIVFVVTFHAAMFWLTVPEYFAGQYALASLAALAGLPFLGFLFRNSLQAERRAVE